MIIRRYKQAKAKCIHCGKEHLVRWANHAINDILTPYAGGGAYGTCVLCKKPGLRVVEIPPPVITKPVGWKEVPTK